MPQLPIYKLYIKKIGYNCRDWKFEKKATATTGHLQNLRTEWLNTERAVQDTTDFPYVRQCETAHMKARWWPLKCHSACFHRSKVIEVGMLASLELLVKELSNICKTEFKHLNWQHCLSAKQIHFLPNWLSLGINPYTGQTFSSPNFWYCTDSHYMNWSSSKHLSGLSSRSSNKVISPQVKVV